MVSNIFILDQHLKTKLILSINGSNTFFKDLYDLDLSTGSESYEFSTTAEDINESDYIMFHYHGDYKLFQIIDIEQEHREGKIITSVYGESACLELLNDVVTLMTDTVAMNAINFMNYVLEGSEWQLGRYSSSLENKVIDVKLDRTKQRWTTIQDYMKEFGYEITARVKYENGHVKKKYVDMYAEGELGNKTYKRFEYSRNVKGITKKKDLYDFCTALILNTRQNIIDVQYGEVNGNTLGPKDGFFKSPSSDRLLATENNKIYNLGKPYIFGVYEDSESSSASEALEKAIAELKIRSVPKFDYECDTALTYKEYEDISIGDTVYVIDHTFNPVITLEARVGKLEISFTDRDNCKCTLTNYKEIKGKVGTNLDDIKELLDRTTIQYGDEEEVTIKDDYLDTKERLDQHLRDCEKCGCHDDDDNNDNPGTFSNPIEFYTDDTLVGKIGSQVNDAASSSNRKKELYMYSEPDCYVCIGSSLGKNIIISDEEFGYGGKHYYSGLNLLNPTIVDSTLKFAPSKSLDNYGDGYIGYGELYVDTYKSFHVSGQRNLYFKLNDVGKSTKDIMLAFCTKTDGTNEHYGYLSVDLDVANHLIRNGTIVTSVDAQSEYTTSLINGGANENMMYSNLSYDSGELRWCHKENVFTYAESEIDPETDEWVYTGRYICYVELPIFMAENIQNDYHINVSKMSWGDYRIIEKNPYYFILESQEDNFAFTFEVVAKLNDNQTLNANAIIANNGLAEPEDIDNINKD